MLSIEVDVSLIDIYTCTDSTLMHHTQDIGTIIEWYTGRVISMLDFLQIHLIDIIFNPDRNTLIISYIRKPFCGESVEEVNSFLADPDYGGNYLLHMHEKKYLVSATLS
jgi:hypothetical protein